MENTAENVIKLLKVLQGEKKAIIAACAKAGHLEELNSNISELAGLNNAVWMLTDSKYFNNMYEIYKDKIEG